MKKKLVAMRPEKLIEARYNLTSKENDIIDMILNTIKDDGKHVYKIDIEKYKNLFVSGSTNVYRDIKKATKDLFTKHNKFIIKDKALGKEFYFTWFSMLNYNDKDGSIYFEIGETLKAALLEMKKRIYYELQYTLNFRSIYSKRIYYMLKSFSDTGWRIDNIDDLQYKLNCPPSYKNYAVFKNKVLVQAQKEINGSDISFDFTPIKTGKKVTGIKFLIKDTNTVKVKNEVACTSAKENDKAKEVQEIFKNHEITKKEAEGILKESGGDLNVIRNCYTYALNKNVKNIVGYIRTLVKDFKEPKANVVVDNFNNYGQRKYDFEKIERGLLGWEDDED
ncbi:replication initiation protein [Clostridium felsineum]|nr:RepB family plasmid replication initiator protein [Clostridium felsineum]MCR3760009.1 RepB family plasmid replication initiator protein [Clostridium felsineum]